MTTPGMTDEQMAKLDEMFRDPAKVEAALPQAERDHYRRCQQSVIDSRRAAEREAGQHFVY